MSRLSRVGLGSVCRWLFLFQAKTKKDWFKISQVFKLKKLE